MSEFDGIEGLDGWRKKLESLLAEARQVAREDNLEDRLSISERLTDFILKSRPNTREIQKLDSIAEETASGLLLDSIDKRLANITARTGEYKRLTKDFETQAEENKAAADSIRLRIIIETVDSATETINAAKKLKESLKNNAKEKEVAKLIDETVTAIEKLRSKVGRLI